MMRANTDSRLITLLTWLHRGEDIVLSILLILTLGTAFVQIMLRNFLGTSIVWADVLVRILVLWLGMLGAMIATREGKHINIDLISRYLSPAHKQTVMRVVSFFAGGVCAAAGYFSLVFVISEYQAGETAFAAIPAWVCEAILPLGFMMTALRYLLQGVVGITRNGKADPP